MSIIIVLTEGSAIIYIEIDRVFLKQRIKSQQTTIITGHLSHRTCVCEVPSGRGRGSGRTV